MAARAGAEAGAGRATAGGVAPSGINATCTESASAAASSGESGVATAMRRMITVPWCGRTHSAVAGAAPPDGDGAAAGAGVTSQSQTRSAPRVPAPRSSPVARSGRSAIATRTPRGEKAASSAESSAGSGVATSIAGASAPRAARIPGSETASVAAAKQSPRALAKRTVFIEAAFQSDEQRARVGGVGSAGESIEVGRQQRARRLSLPALRREPRLANSAFAAQGPDPLASSR